MNKVKVDDTTQSMFDDSVQREVHDEAFEIAREIKKNRPRIRKMAKAQMEEQCAKCVDSAGCAHYNDLDFFMIRYTRIEWDDYMGVHQMAKKCCKGLRTSWMLERDERITREKFEG